MQSSCVFILEMRAEAMHGSISMHMCSRNNILSRSAQILFVIGTAFAMHVNARSSNY